MSEYTLSSIEQRASSLPFRLHHSFMHCMGNGRECCNKIFVTSAGVFISFSVVCSFGDSCVVCFVFRTIIVCIILQWVS